MSEEPGRMRADPKEWMVFVIRRDLLERAGAIGDEEAQHEG